MLMCYLKTTHSINHSRLTFKLAVSMLFLVFGTFLCCADGNTEGAEILGHHGMDSSD